MCIMEVRAGQHASTIAQAMAHNTSTVERDLDMFEALLHARNDHESLATVREAHDHLRKAYASLLAQFGYEVAEEVAHGGHDHGDHGDHGNERSFVAQAQHDAVLARRYETR